MNSDLLTTITVINCRDKLSSSSCWIAATVESNISTFYLELTTEMAHAAEEVGHYDHYLVSHLSILDTYKLPCADHHYQEVSSLGSTLPGDNTE